MSSRGNSESSKDSYTRTPLIQRPNPKSYGSVNRRRKIKRTKAFIDPKDSELKTIILIGERFTLFTKQKPLKIRGNLNFQRPNLNLTSDDVRN